MKIYKTIPDGRAECPVCKGTGRIDAGNISPNNCYAGYDKETHTLQCDNCGAQYMFSSPRGYVKK